VRTQGDLLEKPLDPAFTEEKDKNYGSFRKVKQDRDRKTAKDSLLMKLNKELFVKFKTFVIVRILLSSERSNLIHYRYTDKPWTDKPWTRQTLDTTNSGQHKPWTQ
jgi:hypothetical protein